MAESVFTEPRREADFQTAYDAVLAQWPANTEALDVPTPYGRTRVHRCGPASGRPLVLLHGGGATSTAWFAVASGLADAFRVHAPDLVGDAGRSVPGDTRLRRPDDLHTWLDAVLDGLSLDRTSLGGHSYGGWIALTYALARPHRVERLALLEPSSCFAPMAPAYLLRGIPILLKNTPARLRGLFEWETRGRALDPAWFRLMLASTGGRWQTPVLPKRPKSLRLGAPTLVVIGGRSRSQDPDRVRRTAEALPDVTTVTIPEASHHTIPTEDADRLAAAVRTHLS
ncbi:alpha/beta fold hydrolase [Cryptosporangium aurantiacum]|uniref:Pimeloyl-ACP methyl ester carboxylesterase n=1 Tax=Cryptosporangium aurantiacum TaxID=134849 RepID=A0A1M7TYT8_9ACTN|nr:alpha/beta hydrolase [Cryptosporangium aurantiacum]SHN75901.1 Pimeloyl-ACP methyl ester carboxylesterase [Cryptosporangium aurantiacum]